MVTYFDGLSPQDPITICIQSYGGVRMRLSEEEMKLLDEYCKKNNITRPQGLRDGLKALFSK